MKRMGANTHANIEGIYQRLPLISQALPEGAALQLYYHQAALIMINVPLALIGGIILDSSVDRPILIVTC